MRFLVVCVVIGVSLLGGRTVDGGEPFVITPDVAYGHKDGLAMTFDVVSPEQRNGAAVLFMVSGGWFSRWTPPERFVGDSARANFGRFRQLVEKGYTLFLVRHGSAPKYKVPEAVSDVRQAVRFIRSRADQFKIDPRRIGVFGGSAGGHLSLMLGFASADGMVR